MKRFEVKSKSGSSSYVSADDWVLMQDQYVFLKNDRAVGHFVVSSVESINEIPPPTFEISSDTIEPKGWNS